MFQLTLKEIRTVNPKVTSLFCLYASSKAFERKQAWNSWIKNVISVPKSIKTLPLPTIFPFNEIWELTTLPQTYNHFITEKFDSFTVCLLLNSCRQPETFFLPNPLFCLCVCLFTVWLISRDRLQQRFLTF